MEILASLLEILRTCLSTKLLCPLHLTFWQGKVLRTLRLPADTKGRNHLLISVHCIQPYIRLMMINGQTLPSTYIHLHVYIIYIYISLYIYHLISLLVAKIKANIQDVERVRSWGTLAYKCMGSSSAHDIISPQQTFIRSIQERTHSRAKEHGIAKHWIKLDASLWQIWWISLEKSCIVWVGNIMSPILGGENFSQEGSSRSPLFRCYFRPYQLRDTRGQALCFRTEATAVPVIANDLGHDLNGI